MRKRAERSVKQLLSDQYKSSSNPPFHGPVSCVGLQKVVQFPVNFGNFPETLETYQEFWNVSGIFGKFTEILRKFSTPLQA